jgi:hypothetical protein
MKHARLEGRTARFAIRNHKAHRIVEIVTTMLPLNVKGGLNLYSDIACALR